MNKELILKLVQPYLKDNKLTYEDFDRLFCFLSKKEQYLVVDVLIEIVKEILKTGVFE